MRTRHAVRLLVGSLLATTGGLAGCDVSHEHDGEGGPRTSAGVVETVDWRTEYWGEVAVDVPPEWGYGGAPLERGLICSDPRTPDGRHAGYGTLPGYVGRPIVMTDVCGSYSRAMEPEAPYVWLESGLDEGAVHYANGYVEETVVVAGVAVTVASDDAAVREQILATVRAQDGPCLADLVSVPRGTFGWTFEGVGAFVDASACVYRRDGEGDFVLAYGASLSDARIRHTWDALRTAERHKLDEPCGSESEFAVVQSTYLDGAGGSAHVDQRLVYRPGCGVVDVGESLMFAPGGFRDLTGTLGPWKTGGVPAVLSFLIGPRG